MKIAIIGGGPAGLYFARLMKRQDSGHDVRVLEQNPPDATYGFGVTMAGQARARLKEADPEVHDRLAAAMLFNNQQRICLDNDGILIEYAAAGGAIERKNLLRILQESCLEVGVTLETEKRISSIEDFTGYDLIVGADGVNSVVRSLYQDQFGTRISPLTNPFAWYGVPRALNPNALVFRHADGGVFVAHYYRYTPIMSTFVAECDFATWKSSGLETASDQDRRLFFEKLFRPELDGAPLIENKSMWRRFNVVTNDRWFHRNVVLVGDALRVAHFSIGSGTRLAMEDSLALADAFRDVGGDVPAALTRYVETRKPVRDLFGEATERSFMWYENVRQAMNQPLMDFAYDFLTRTGRVDDERLKSYAPGFFQQYQAYRLKKTA